MKYIILIGCLLYFIQSVSIGVEGGSKKCFFFDVYEERTLKIPFVVTGINEENVSVDLFLSQDEQGNEVNTTLVSLKNQKEGTLRFNPTVWQEVNLCFTSLDSYYKVFSFDVDHSGIDKNYADKQQMDETEGTLRQTLSKMHKVYRNQHFQMDRENYHEILMSSTENQVKWCALCKIIVLMGVCLIQIYMLTNFFKDKSFGPSV